MHVSLYTFVGVLILQFNVLKVTSNGGSDCILLNSELPPLRRKRMSKFGGPKRGVNYNPNYGYEPYWPGGDWVFPSTPDHKKICTERCPKIYIEFGQICGRNLSYTHKTFNNYCDLLREDCTGREKWLIAYRGKCQGDLKTYPTEHAKMRTRAMAYIEDFNYRNPKKYIHA